MLVSRTIQAPFRQLDEAIVKLISFVDGNQLLSDYIQSIPKYSFEGSGSIEKEIEAVSGVNGMRFSLGSDRCEEISATYQILKFISNAPDVFAYYFGEKYSSSNAYQDWADAFNETITNLFASDIDLFLEGISIDMGFDENKRVSIVVNNGQANVNVGDNGNIQATQHNSAEIDQLTDLIGGLKKILDDENTPADVKNGITAQTDILDNEIRQTSPDKHRVQGVLTTLKALSTTVVSIAGATDAIQHIIEMGTSLISSL